MKTHRYMRNTIKQCERVTGEHDGEWIIQSYHLSGMKYADELCLHFKTLNDTKKYIKEIINSEQFDIPSKS